ncbi:sulfite exporter TauE/SafE family protein [Pseudanabaena mucicola]|uniref:Probable membrane transporter protein n=1 Tax=Pseudanabaena mucicola FACHB-723 TaxID=2692860 RepID=A0ABR7ZWR9_9CYAN|nr:sulfite exporter TauE/SafE family protein [Pseudanabaena mucicola]MBD2188406.1 sulfite exporter TauE/SafE family protein [Pseudanabaena mucicola FACHB-723]
MFWQYLLIFGAAILAGAINGIAGGGSFILFPALMFAGLPPIPANATNAIALLPGTLASAGAYRSEFGKDLRSLIQVCILGLIGGLLGAILLLRTPPADFLRILPYLLLTATLAFSFSKNLTLWVEQQQARFARLQALRTALITILQLVVAVYGGFFGGGMGILFLASFALMGMTNIHRMNAYKTILTSCINAIIIIPFVNAGVILWQEAAIAAVGAIIGGYISAYYAQKIAPILVRRLVIVVGIVMTLYFFVRSWMS